MVLLVEPSPKSQSRLVMAPTDASVKVTSNGRVPLAGLPVKSALGISAETPVTVLVWWLLLLALKVTLLEKEPAASGVKLSTTLVEVWPKRLKVAPETSEKGPPVTTATPLLSGASPRLRAVKLAWPLEPLATRPKSRVTGRTDT